ncbi:MAG: phosphoribosylamine--glycine ligase [Anaerolineae bacterium]|nr:phosphoribosylamine--glycine ligase [Anaerolineae bacterium]
MRILVVGSGGREHALAWKLAQSPRVAAEPGSAVFVAPGNGGTGGPAPLSNVSIVVDDAPALVRFAKENHIDLVVVGPEVPLVAGLVDALQVAGVRAFGPVAAAAQLEGSKSFAKRFMIEEGIPTAPAVAFTDYDAALAYLRQLDGPCVVKADGLAAGKGVLVCGTRAEAEAALHQIMVERAFGAAGDQVLVETRLDGEETSLLAFCDGTTAVPLLPARDYKRALDGDAGLNTGGMGGYCPSPHLTPELVEEMTRRVLQPVVDGMRWRGTPYVGVLYAGLMLTAQGPRVLEFNCRFGDPETQLLMPLLDTDLVDIALACIEGRLCELPIAWKPFSSVGVVLASGGYPGKYAKGKVIAGGGQTLHAAGQPIRDEDVILFHAGTKVQEDALVTSGGRVLVAVAVAPNIAGARAHAYEAVKQIHFEGMQYRTDIAANVRVTNSESANQRIGESANQRTPSSPAYRLPSTVYRSNLQHSYASAGVDIDTKMAAFREMQAAVRSTYTTAVLGGIGAFGGQMALDDVRRHDAVLVASTDGVGTKTLIAEAMRRYDTVGHDIVNHCVNDVLVQGARPLFFLDYIASSKLDSGVIVSVVSGCAAACCAVGCVLIGGETAEMPDVYKEGAFDLAGTLVGWVERDKIIDGRNVRPGDVCLGLPSTGLHTNGYSLARRVFADLSWETVLPELGCSVGEALLAPHKSYLAEFDALVAAGVQIKAMAHITGGGFPDNLPRVLPQGIGARIDRSAWPVPPIFRLIQQRGQVDADEMYRVFNMGMGMIVIVSPEAVAAARVAVPEAVVIGKAISWDGAGARVQL